MFDNAPTLAEVLKYTDCDDVADYISRFGMTADQYETMRVCNKANDLDGLFKLLKELA